MVLSTQFEPKREDRFSILIVSDSVAEQENLSTLTQRWGYTPQVLNTGSQALELICNSHVQLVLIDYRCNQMEKIKLCEQVRRFQFDRYVYVILMLPRSDNDDLVLALEEGADEVLVKPIESAELEARLNSAERRIQLQEFLSQQNIQLKRAYEAFKHDLRTVYLVQRSYLPRHDNVLEDLFIEWLAIPSRYVSGDHLDVFQIQPGIYGFYLFDVSGHGVSAAVKAMQLAQLLSHQNSNRLIVASASEDQYLPNILKPSVVVSALNKLYQQTEKDWSFVTLVYGLYDLNQNQVTFCQAGHPSPFLLHADYSISEPGIGGAPIGLFDDVTFEDQTLSVQPGDLLLLYSDGITEAMSPDGELFGSERLAKIIQEGVKQVGPWQLSSLIYDRVEEWVGAKSQLTDFEDDVSFLMLGHRHAFSEALNTNKRLKRAEDIEQKKVDLGVFSYLHTKPEKKTGEQTVLIVDDSGPYLAILRSMVKSWGYSVLLANDGAKAIDLYKQYQPEFVLTDWNMPTMNGIELCKNLRRMQGKQYCYIILITGYASRDELLHSLHVGADDFLIKPVNPGELKARLNNAQRISALHQDLSFKHQQLTDLHEAMRQDVLEVARIQHSLLPTSRQSCWPVAIQTVLIPTQQVAGKQIVVLEKDNNQLLFMLISLPEVGTSAALKVMSLTRYLTMDQGINLLFPLHVTGTRPRRYLAPAKEIVSQLSSVFPNSEKEGFYDSFDLLYGLLQLDEGSLIVSSIGEWQMVVAPWGQTVQLTEWVDASLKPSVSQNARVTSQLSQHILSPGTQLYFLPKACAHAISLLTANDWDRCVSANRAFVDGLSEQVKLLQNQVVPCAAQAFSQNASAETLNATISDQNDSYPKPPFPDFVLLVLQWQEFSKMKVVDTPEDESRLLREYVDRLANAEFKDCFVQPKKSLQLGEFIGISNLLGLANMHSLEQICAHAGRLIEPLNFSVVSVYNVELVLSEALVNIMKHGFSGQKPRDTQVLFVVFEHYLGIIIRDQGLAIPASLFENARPDMSFVDELSLKELPESGMGLTFLTMSSSCLRYTSQTHLNELVMLVAGQNKVVA